MLTGDPREIGPELTANPLVRKLTFTGSTEVGRLLLARSAATVKRTSMELGGNAPVLVLDDVDLDLAVAGVLAAKYRNTGQAWVSANRVHVQDGVYDVFAAKLVARVAELVVGDGCEEGVQQGPLIDEDAVAKVEAQVADAVGHGAEVLHGGRRHARGGLLYEPTVLTGVTAAMAVTREETFGPVTPLIRFTDEQDAVRAANDTESGLAAYLFARDTERIWRIGAALEAGMVGVDTGLISNEVAPFGGVQAVGDRPGGPGLRHRGVPRTQVPRPGRRRHPAPVKGPQPWPVTPAPRPVNGRESTSSASSTAPSRPSRAT
ncbi:aldehyde dehydrogenase family protein [Streptomyces sp. NPDC094038]|uniref:aldehyde dehydrogenase family protein n=1 Tax=Streptomyces sp. NPDC094038 TaxID=3366055 RepID=UPI003824501C